MNVKLTQDQIEPIIELYLDNQFEIALNLVKDLIIKFPEDSVLFNINGLCLLALDKSEEAVEQFKKSISLNPHNAQAHFNLGVYFHGIKDYDSALKKYNNVKKIIPNYPSVYNNIGLILFEENKLSDAIIHFEKALSFDPNFSEAHNNLGAALQKSNKNHAAILHFKKAINLNPNYDQAFNNLGIIFQSLGDKKNAIKNFESALIKNPNFISAHMNLTNVKKYIKFDSQANQMLSLLSKNLNQIDRICLCFSLAKVFEDLGELDAQFKYLKNGNKLFSKKLKYVFEKDYVKHSNIKKIFENQTEAIVFKPNQKIANKIPIFIVGLPRSGTTLVEQVLSSHHEVYGAEELNSFGKLASELIDNKISSENKQLIHKDLIEIRKKYFEEVSFNEFNNTRFTDKMHMNFQYIGFILAAFPEAKIVHLKRDARATCWSIYKHFFSDTKNGWAYDMIDVASFYNSYSDLMSFWHELYPNQIYDICYEDLTTNQEEETRKLLEYCDLEWDENCLNFHKNERAVKTASALQVRKKMYQGSSEAWKKYESYLKPMINELK